MRSIFIVCLGLALLLGVSNAKDEGEDSIIEDETVSEQDSEKQQESTKSSSSYYDTEEDDSKKSGMADTFFMFTEMAQTTGGDVGLFAGKQVQFVVGLANRGLDSDADTSDKKLLPEYLEASFRYPLEYNYYLQNFSKINLEGVASTKGIGRNEEATFSYSMIPADAFIGRPMGLTVNLAYRDSDGNSFVEGIFNQTVQIIELDEGLQLDTVVMWFTIAAIFTVLAYFINKFSAGKFFKKSSQSSNSDKHGSTGNDVGGNSENGSEEVDYEWIPKSALKSTPSASPRTSPRQRKEKGGATKHLQS